MKTFLARVLEGAAIAGSVTWLIFASTFISSLWDTESVTDGWSVKLPYIPIGFVMLAVWIVGFIILIVKTKPKE